jgi:hypothetical protein
MTGERYIPGDNWIIDDQSGLKIRASKARLQWDGQLVHERHFDPRHPQDFVRAIPDHQAADITRPRGLDAFIGPLQTETTEAALPGEYWLVVVTTNGMEVGDALTIILANGDTFRTTIASFGLGGYLLTEAGDYLLADDGSRLTWSDTTATTTGIVLTDPLPDTVAIGAAVFDNTAMSDPTLS